MRTREECRNQGRLLHPSSMADLCGLGFQKTAHVQDTGNQTLIADCSSAARELLRALDLEACSEASWPRSGVTLATVQCGGSWRRGKLFGANAGQRQHCNSGTAVVPGNGHGGTQAVWAPRWLPGWAATVQQNLVIGASGGKCGVGEGLTGFLLS